MSKPLSTYARATLGLLAVSFLALSLLAQSEERKVIKRVQPDYPEVLRVRGIGGVVKVEVSVSAAGIVKTTRVLGGNAALAESAENAVKQWRFEPAATDATFVVSIHFTPFGQHP
jgi:TonB family protein